MYVGINTTRGPLADARVRQAINYAIDVARIIERLDRRTRHARRRRRSRRRSPGTTARAKALPVRSRESARQLLAAAGHPNGIDVELWTSHDADLPAHRRDDPGIPRTLSGIRTKIVQRECAAARAAARKGETDMILKDWYADYPDAEDFLYPLLHSANKGVGGNVSFYSNPQFDSLVTAARREQDEAKRDALYQQADAIAFDDAPMMFLYFYNELYAVQPWIKNFVPPVIFNGQRWTRRARIEATARKP